MSVLVARQWTGWQKCARLYYLKEKAGGGNGEEVYIISFSLAAQYPYFGGYNGLSGLVRLLAGSSYK